MTDAAVILPAGAKDRRVGLVVFGSLSILVGLGCLLLGGLTALASRLAPAAATIAPGAADAAGHAGPRALVPAVALYGSLAVAFVWLGVGSILLRRWARALLLILCSAWLATGLIGLAAVAALLPPMLADGVGGGEPLPGTVRVAVVAIVGAILSFFLVVLPGAMVLFYRSRHVRATVEAYDTATHWTDACPPSVLALSILMGSAVLLTALQFLSYRPVVPLFGALVSGAPGTILMTLLMASWLYGAWHVYRLRGRGWWVLTVTSTVMVVSTLVTFARVDPAAFYREAGYSADEVAMIQQMPIMSRTAADLVVAVTGLPFIAYLLALKRHFRRM